MERLLILVLYNRLTPRVSRTGRSHGGPAMGTGFSQHWTVRLMVKSTPLDLSICLRHFIIFIMSEGIAYFCKIHNQLPRSDSISSMLKKFTLDSRG